MTSFDPKRRDLGQRNYLPIHGPLTMIDSLYDCKVKQRFRRYGSITLTMLYRQAERKRNVLRQRPRARSLAAASSPTSAG